ncbi:MAG: purine-nucleoside phosphorylase [Oscillospiraceae bacterium]|nr:purine-nucleoside phosphorylase [Oscillospiraceae bacterium]MCL2279325.1 purine-nucleoside phosphorylase [Oscillospiraceae bacterium]
MNLIYEKLLKCRDIVRSKTDFVPKVALVLGSGLGGYADEIDVKATVNYSEIEGFPVSTVPGHQGRFVFGNVGDVPVVVMQGRVHYYEGYPMTDVVLPIRLMGLLGAKVLFLTNACGGVNPSFAAGDFMLIKDSILFNVPNPLIGENIEELGTRFPDMSEIYKKDLREQIKSAAQAIGVKMQEGVYMQFTGPSFETPADIRFSATAGADVVGMSTACEAIAANHMGLKVCGISCVSNLAAGISKTPLTHDEVQEMADKSAPQFKALVTESIKRIGQL